LVGIETYFQDMKTEKLMAIKAAFDKFEQRRVKNFKESSKLGFKKIKDDKRNTPLHSAAFKEDVGCIKILIEEAFCEVNVSNIYGITPIMIAEQRNKKVLQAFEDSN